ncbi:MAG: hypothetical protein IJZ89_08465 [Clostridia bacterium]|nr:hypothetical protein [Clostridia bacterium]
MKKIPYTRDQLLDLMTKLYNDPEKYIVAQQMSENYSDGGHKTRDELKWIEEATGKKPAMLGMDIARGAKEYNDEELDILAEELINYASKGGIVTLCGHFRNPHVPKPEDPVWYRGNLGRDEEWEALMTEGTPTNKVFSDDLREAARFIKRLDDAGVPVLWRPLHEMNGGWFWFCIGQDEGYRIPAIYAQRLWRYIYKMFTEEFGMKNLIWVYSPNIGCEGTVMYPYPGDDIIDLVAFDWYSNGNYEIGTEWGSADYKALTATGKPFGIGEFGPGNDNRTNLDVSPEYKFNNEDARDLFAKMHKDGYKFAWVMFWSSWAKVKISLWNMGKGEVIMNDPAVLDLEKVNEFYKTGKL